MTKGRNTPLRLLVVPLMNPYTPISRLEQRWVIPTPESESEPAPIFTKLEPDSESESTFFTILESESESESEKWTGIGAGIMHYGISPWRRNNY